MVESINYSRPFFVYRIMKNVVEFCWNFNSIGWKTVKKLHANDLQIILTAMRIWNKKISAVIAVSILTTIFIFLLLKIPSVDSKKITQIYFADHISSAHHILIKKFNDKFAGRIEVVPINFPAGSCFIYKFMPVSNF